MSVFNLVYPNAATIHEIDQDLIRDQAADDVTLKLLPAQPEAAFFVRWFQLDNYYGIMGMRGLDGSPSRVVEVGTNSYTYEPGVYGEYMTIGEREIRTRAAPMNPSIPIPVTDLVTMKMKQLKARAYDRMRYNIWTLLGTGVLNIPLAGPAGSLVYQDTYSIQTLTAGAPWSSHSTATPILDFQRAQQLSVGHSVDFGSRAVAFMNQNTANDLVNNSNTSDFGGRRASNGATLNNLPDMVNYFGKQNLPTPTVFDDGYQPYPNNGPLAEGSGGVPPVNFLKFIPNRLVIIVGLRTNGAPVGHFKQTISTAQLPGGSAPGEYAFIKDYARGINAPIEVPPRLEIHNGFDGGPVLEYPSSVIALSV